MDKNWGQKLQVKIQNIAALLDLLSNPRIAEDKRRVFRIQKVLASYYKEIGDNYYAIEAISVMWELYKADSSHCTSKEMIVMLSELAMLYQQTDDAMRAEEYANLAIKLAGRQSSQIWLKYPYEVLGELCLSSKDYHRAKWYFEACIRYAHQENDSATLAKCTCHLMRTNIHLGTTNSLLSDAERGLSYGEYKGACKLVKSCILLNLAFYYYGKNQLDLSLDKINQATGLMENTHAVDALKVLSEFLDLKIEILKRQGNYKLAVIAYQMQLQVKDRVHNILKNEARLNYSLRYYINQTKTKLVLTEERLHKFEKQTKKKNVLIGAFCTVLVVLMYFVMSQLALLKKVRKYNALLIRKNQVINTQRNQINLQREQLQDHVNKLEFENLISKYEIVKSQIDPHFLFNTFNLLKISITKSSKNAVSLVQHISEFYRSTLRTSDHVLSSLEDELQMIRSYVVIQSIRYNDCFLINTRVDNSLMKHKIPTRSLQLVIENIFKHNELSRARPILINIYHQDRHLVVENTIRAKLKLDTISGYGQKNITKRYNLLGNTEPVFSETESFYVVKLPLIKDEY